MPTTPTALASADSPPMSSSPSTSKSPGKMPAGKRPAVRMDSEFLSSESESDIGEEAFFSGANDDEGGGSKRSRVVDDLDVPSQRATYNTRASSVPVRPPPVADQQSSTSELDLSIFIALISPLGNWITGGDHVRDLLLVALLVFYLHQLITVPWELYRAARPKRSISGPARPSTDKHVALAARELKVHEFMYLGFSVLSPFLGVFFMRYILSIINGKDPLTWFSSTLFVLATGLRPFRHLISRLSERTHDLHSAVHYPDSQAMLDAKFQALTDRVLDLETELRKVKSRAAQIDGVEEVYGEFMNAVEDVEKVVKRNHRKAEVTRATQDNRLIVLEKSLTLLLQENRQLHANGHANGYSAPPPPPEFPLPLSHRLFTAIFFIPMKFLSVFDSAPPEDRHQPHHNHPLTNGSTEKALLQALRNHGRGSDDILLTPTRLEPIFESENESESASRPAREKNLKINTGGLSQNSKPRPMEDAWLTLPQTVASCVHALVTSPYRVSLLIIRVITAPIRRLVVGDAS